MNPIRTLLPALLFSLLALVGGARADHMSGTGMATGGMAIDPMTQMNQLMDLANQRVEQATRGYLQSVENLERFYIDYYLQNGGDPATPYGQAVDLGKQLFCGHYPANCQQVAQSNRQWAQLRNQQHQSNMDQLDSSHRSWMDDQQRQYEGHQNWVQGAVHGESTFLDPWGSPVSLPVYPTPGTSYTGPTGLPVQFDYSTETWWQQSYDGSWYPMQQQR